MKSPKMRINQSILSQYFIVLGLTFCFAQYAFGQEAKQELRAVKVPLQEKDKEEKPDIPASDSEIKDLLTSKGITNEISEEISKMIQFGWDDKKITPTIQTADANKAYEIVQEIQRKIGFGGGGSSWGGDTWSFRVNSQKLNFHYQRNKIDKAIVTQLTLIEKKKPERKVNLVIREKGAFQLTIEGKAGSGYLFRLMQKESGEFVAQEIDGIEIKSFVSNNFEQFCKEHTAFSTDRLVPMIERFGFGTLITPFNSNAKDHVLYSLVPLSEQQLAEFDEQVKQLDSSSYAQREEATKKLAENYPNVREVLMRVSVDKRFSPEVRDRAAEVVQQQEKGDVADVVKFVTARKLATNTDYLVWLLANETREKFRKQIVKQICEIEELSTKVDDGTFQAWFANYQRKSNDERDKQTTKTVTTSDLVAKCAALKKAKPGIGRLLKLKISEATIQLDTEHWAKPFGGKTIKEHSDAIKKELESRGLPADWYSPGGSHSESSAGYEQVLFERMEAEMKIKNPRYRSYSNDEQNEYGRSNKNRKINGQTIIAQLAINDKTTGRRATNANESNYHPKFLLLFEEQTEARSEFLFAIEEDDGVQIRFSNLEDNAYIRLLINKDKQSIIQDIRGNQVVTKRAESFSALVEENADYFSKDFFPLLDALGVTLDPNEISFTPLREEKE